jgi:hypothetical protein
MDSFYQLIPATNPVAIRQQRIWCNCLLLLPDDVRNSTPLLTVERCHGNFVLGFSQMPILGEKFPFEGQIWEVVKHPIQFPSRYKTRSKKKPAIVITKWACSYNNDEEMMQFLLD